MLGFSEYVQGQEKLWKASREEIFRLWQSLHPNIPIRITPIPPTHKGTRFDNDGLRITGTAEFITSILARLKDFMPLDHGVGTKLDVEYRQTGHKKDDINGAPVYVFYIHLVTDEPQAVA